MARPRRRVPILQALERQTDDLERHLLIESYSSIYTDTLNLLARGAAPTQKSKGMSKRLGEIEARLHDRPVPEDVVLVELGEMWKRAARGMGKG